MRHVIIASHHRFAEGLADTLEFIGGVENMRAVCAYVDETPLEEQAPQAEVSPEAPKRMEAKRSRGGKYVPRHMR